jgi:DNA-binding protein H-NS
MTHLDDLIAQKEELERKIEAIQVEERKSALDKIFALIGEFEFTAQDIFGRKAGRALSHLDVLPLITKTSKTSKKQAKPLAPPAKYRDPTTGKTWTGKGRAPDWLQGKNREDFAV